MDSVMHFLHLSLIRKFAMSIGHYYLRKLGAHWYRESDFPFVVK